MMNIFALSRKIHRLLVLVISLMTLIMGTTGTFMKYPNLAPGFVDLGMVRALHNGISVWFTLALVLMAVTGLFMYFIPYLRTKNANEQNQIN